KAEESVRLIGAGAPSADVVQGALGAEIVIFAVPDDALEKTAARVRAGGKFGPGDIWMHTSGAAPALTLWPGARGGEAGGDGTEREGAGRPGLLSMHPVQSVADPRTGAERLVGAFFGLEGDEAALLAGER